MPGAQPRRSPTARRASSGLRRANIPAGAPGVYGIRPRGGTPPASDAFTSGGGGTPGDLTPVYWYDAADATGSDWVAHSSFGLTLTAGGSPTLVGSAVNGQPGVRLDAGESYAGSESAHAFTNGMAALYVVKMGTNPGSRLQMNAGSSTSYIWSDSSFGEVRLEYTDELGSFVRYTYDAPAGSAAYICEWTISAAGVPSLKYNGAAQVETGISGSAGGTTESVADLSIGIPAQSPTVCELIVYDANDSAGLADARSFLSTKYALSA